MPYQPIARKYRPKTFHDLVGQPHVTATLIRAIESGRVGQAYLFCGQRGVGKTSAARILATSLNCLRGPTPKPCHECASCAAIAQGTSMDVIEIDGASNRGIDDVRQLREQVKFSPVHGHFRVYIIDEVHQITADAFNALLKTLEEPPAHAKFIFATTAPHKVPPTILSRCQRFDFRRLPVSLVVSVLEEIAAREQIAIEPRALQAVAQACEGSLRDAEVILEQLTSFCEGAIREADVSQLLGTLESDALISWTDAIVDRDAALALRILHEQLARGKEFAQLLTGLIAHLRNLLVLATVGSANPETVHALLDVPSDQLATLARQAQRCTVDEWLLMIQVLNGAYDWMRRSPFAQTVLELAVIKLTTRGAWMGLDQLIQRVEHTAQEAGGQSGSPSAMGAPTSVIISAPRVPPGPIDRPTSARSARESAAQPANVSSLDQHMHADPSVSGAAMAETIAAFQDVLEKWPEVLARIGAQKMSLAAYLTEAKPLAIVNSTLQIGLPGFSLHQEVLNLPENLRVIEQILQEAVGCALVIRYSVLPEPPPGAEQTDARTSREPFESQKAAFPPLVQEIVSLFDATVVRQPPQPSS